MINGTEREAIHRAIRSHGEVDEAYLAAYYGLVPTERLLKLRPEDLLGIALGHRELARTRQPGQDLVRVHTPTVARDGWAVGASVVETVTEDRAFLVDSLRGTLEMMGHRVSEVFHPIFHVTRTPSGDLVDVVARNGDDGPGTNESWIHLHIPRLHDPAEAEHLTQVLHTVLGDVRAAVDDWGAMSAQMWQAANHVDDREQAALLRFLTEDEFVFLGSVRYDVEGEEVIANNSTRLGIARRLLDAADLPLDTPARQLAWGTHQVIVTKGSHPSPLLLGRHNDIVAVKVPGPDGAPAAEIRFVGALANTVHSGSTSRVPSLRTISAQVLADLDVSRDSHAGRELLEVIDRLPRQTLFNADPHALAQSTLELRELSAHPRVMLLADVEPFQRYVTFTALLPRDRYSTRSRLQITDILMKAVDGASVEYQTQVSNSPLAQLTFTIRVAQGSSVGHIDVDALERVIDGVGRDWNEELQAALVEEFGDARGDELAGRYLRAFPISYTEQMSGRIGAWDTQQLDALRDEPLRLTLYRPAGAADGVRRLKLYLSRDATLSTLLPLFNDLGVTVTDEHPYEVTPRDGRTQHLLDLGLHADEQYWQAPGAAERFQDAVRGAWLGTVQSDGLAALVLVAGLSVRQVVILRTVVAYLRQLGLSYSTAHVHQVLLRHPEAARLLVDLFEVRCDPDRFDDMDERQAAADQVGESLAEQVDAVTSLDQEAILEGCKSVITAVLRTNFYRREADGGPEPAVALKLDTQTIALAPQPRPYREIWVHGPRVEGVHLRFGPVARGGLRWSDRREDFRTEVLGLVKAQVVKNAVIVPAGAKGGFFAKRLPPPSDREAWLAEGRVAYQQFIGAMLSVTDNRVDGQVVAPERVVRHDEDDTYLVVAADKGTATFSDLANAISLARGFWLGDAFASGGSNGFDHKAMGITARGAWQSVMRHFRERGLDTQAHDFTVVGIGDMSGDVFGNGMLCSPHIRLVAAFDHRHIFVDPNPDASTGFAERERLYHLPRSSWADYDTTLISEGGGVWARDAKSIPVSEQMRLALGLTLDKLTPPELVSAILRAPVDLLWNGGIGTWVKASSERHDQVGDRANDPVRIDAAELRCRVVGEGGNLGFTQRARIEAALAGIGVNTDAIDNSAGVDTSDHEVNIKIVLDGAVRAGDLTAKQRDQLLGEMVDEVAEHVLRTNYEQNVLLGNARTQDAQMVGPHQRLMRQLEQTVGVDRALEALPSDAELVDRQSRLGRGMTTPEFAVVLAWAKIEIKQQLIPSPVLDDPWFDHVLVDYFPASVRQRFAAQIHQHPLRREIVANAVANAVLNRGGISFVFRATEETGASVEDVVEAFIACREVFGLGDYTEAVEALDNLAPTRAQTELYLRFRRLLDRAVRRTVLSGGVDDITGFVRKYRSGVEALWGLVPGLLQGRLVGEYQATVRQLTEWNVPDALARRSAGLGPAYVAFDAVDLATKHGVEVSEVLRIWFDLLQRLRISDLLDAITRLGHQDRWDAMARTSARLDAQHVLGRVVSSVLECGQSVDEWYASHEPRITEGMGTVLAALQVEDGGLAPVSVSLRALRNLAR
ncbi:NAD-glutamate dehydrogenase [Propionibacteriaceae bacterium G57]|uniref:NAD-glutamate dehydrogenase n=1 Tax=Aestuariimicrobium sp. G57 TaxID=3418485 RepID=UPI003DA72105